MNYNPTECRGWKGSPMQYFRTLYILCPNDSSNNGMELEGKRDEAAASRCCLSRHLFDCRFLSLIILLVSAVNVMLVGGKRRCFGIFLTGIRADMTSDGVPDNQNTLNVLNWVGDSYSALAFFLLPLATALILHFDKCYRISIGLAGAFITLSAISTSFAPSPPFMFLTHTLLHGIGSALTLSTTSLIISDYFDKGHRLHVFATAFLNGGAFGALVSCPLYGFLVSKLGWRHAFQVVGSLFLTAAVLGVIFFEKRNDQESPQGYVDPNTKTDRCKNIWLFCTMAHLQQNPQIVFWLLERILQSVLAYSLIMNLTEYFTRKVGSIAAGSNLILVYVVGGFIVFVLGAILGDFLCDKLRYVYLAVHFIRVFLLLTWKFYNTGKNENFAFAFFVGASMGAGNNMVFATAEEITNIDGKKAYSMSMLAMGVGMLTAPMFSGLVIDKYGYQLFFVVQIVLSAVAFLLMAGVCGIILYKQTKNKKLDEGDQSLDQ